MSNGVMFFMNDETATDILKEGICFGVNFGEARHSDERNDEKEPQESEEAEE